MIIINKEFLEGLDVLTPTKINTLNNPSASVPTAVDDSCGNGSSTIRSRSRKRSNSELFNTKTYHLSLGSTEGGNLSQGTTELRFESSLKKVSTFNTKTYHSVLNAEEEASFSRLYELNFDSQLKEVSAFNTQLCVQQYCLQRMVLVREEKNSRAYLRFPSNHCVQLGCSYPKRLKHESETTAEAKYTSSNMILLKTAMKNSMLMNGEEEAEFAEENMDIRRIPSSISRRHFQNHCRAFQVRPSRLSDMSNALDM